MSLRARLVAALTALLAAGMAVYGVGTYRAFATAELDRLDQELRGSLRLVAAELVGELRGADRPGPGPPGRPLVAAPGMFGQLLGPDGEVLAELERLDGTVRPDLSGLDGVEAGQLVTVPSVGADVRWRVATLAAGGGRRLVAAVPMEALDRALDRLVTIEAVAGVALLALLAGGAWAILRRGLRPLERMAATARSINAGSLDQRVEAAPDETEVGQLAAALNGMLDHLEAAFREREATEAKLRRFLADASHELRTPLTSIRGFAELFRLGSDSEHVDLPTAMRRIEEESERMRRLVEDLLMLARLDETHPVERRTVDLAVLAADACSDAVAMEPDRPLRLDAPDPVPVVGDPGHLRQAVGNLLVNALTHTPPGTPVEVSASTRNGHARLTVRDHGPGLGDEELGRVFDRFWQADPSRTGAGTGLGLSIVQAVATEHGGRASAGNAPGGGAVFTIELPVDGGPPPLPTPPEEEWRA